MPVIDIHTTEGVLTDSAIPHLLEQAGRLLLTHEGAPAAPPYSVNAGVFLHQLPVTRMRTVAEAEPAVVRLDVSTPPGALTRDAVQGLVADLTELVRSSARPEREVRTWILVRETIDGGWGVDGLAPTTAELRALAKSAAQAPGDDN